MHVADATATLHREKAWVEVADDARRNLATARRAAMVAGHPAPSRPGLLQGPTQGSLGERCYRR
jgi:hypothetical protein